MYDDLLHGKIDVGANRSDLGENLGKSQGTENITQIMWPSKFIPDLVHREYHTRALAISKDLLGVDMEMDFDMMINKHYFWMDFLNIQFNGNDNPKPGNPWDKVWGGT